MKPKQFRLILPCIYFLATLACQQASQEEVHTRLSIKGDQWYINGEITNPGSPAAGLLMNVRMVNAVFEDRGEGWKKQVDTFDPEENTQNFINHIPEYVDLGVNAFVISLQGGLPGYEGAINTAFEPDGKLRKDYMERVAKVIRAADQQEAVIILTCFYQRQRDHEFALESKQAIIEAVRNSAAWIAKEGFSNVLLEIANEYPHGGYRGWPDSEWLVSEAGQIELMEAAKAAHPDLLVSTSGLGHGRFPEALVTAADFLLIHFNNTALEDYAEKINPLKKYGKPIVCNEDDKIGKEGAAALAYSVLNGAGWGFMESGVNQDIPFEFGGEKDDPEVYKMFKNMSTPGFQLDKELLEQPSITITYPNDGSVFMEGNPLTVQFSHLFQDTSLSSKMVLMVNDKQIPVEDKQKKLEWKPEAAGPYYLRMVVYDGEGELMYQSAPVDIEVSPLEE
ncbi:MAG: hypothetical protein WD431_17755 [Cyclobacteriaceae bacterium]